MSASFAYMRDTLLMSSTQSMIAEEVYTALAKPIVLQGDPIFTALTRQISTQLGDVFGVNKERTMISSAVGRQALEVCLYNLLEPKSTILVLMNGVHGQQLCDFARRLGYEVDTVSMPWGTPILPENIEATLKKKRYALVAVAHGETSTGVVSPLAGLGRMVRNVGAFFMVDCAASLGGMPFALEDWCVDVALSVSHRCLSCPSGLTLLSFSESAVERFKERKTSLLSSQRSLYSLLYQWHNPNSATRMALPVNVVYALHESLRRILAEGLPNVFLRHRSVQKQLIDGMGQFGFRCYAGPAWRLPMMTVFHVPEGLSVSALRETLFQDYAIDVRDSVGDSGHFLRVGHMGHTARSRNVARFVDAVGKSIECC